MRGTAARAATMVATFRPDGTGGRYLNSIGHVAGLGWSDTMPGGAETLKCTVQAAPGHRDPALDPGRLVRAYRGASTVFDGILDEPVPGDDGWAVTAAGAGTWGGRYRAVWTAWTAENVIDAAIGRGLGWVRGTVSGGYLAEQRDSGSLSVTEFLNLIASPGSKTWQVRRTAAGLTVSVFAIPTAVTRLLITTTPAARTLAGYVNHLYARYQKTADANGKAATYDLGSATNQANISRHGRLEEFWDLSSSGVLTGTAANAAAAAALAKYTAVSWAGPFQVAPGQYLTAGGAPVDLGCEHAGEVCRLILADGPYGGEVAAAPPVVFPVGKVDYSDADGTAQITPFQSWTADWSAVLAQLAPKAPA